MPTESELSIYPENRNMCYKVVYQQQAYKISKRYLYFCRTIAKNHVPKTDDITFSKLVFYFFNLARQNNWHFWNLKNGQDRYVSESKF